MRSLDCDIGALAKRSVGTRVRDLELTVQIATRMCWSPASIIIAPSKDQFVVDPQTDSGDWRSAAQMVRRS